MQLIRAGSRSDAETSSGTPSPNAAPPYDAQCQRVAGTDDARYAPGDQASSGRRARFQGKRHVLDHAGPASAPSRLVASWKACSLSRLGIWSSGPRTMAMWRWPRALRWL